MSRTFFRIVRTDPPTVDDFTSAAARGRRITAGLPEALHRLWDGISVYATVAQAQRKARRSPMLGAHVAELLVEEVGPIRFERTTREAGHFTLWGGPTTLLQSVVSVHATEARTSRETEP